MPTRALVIALLTLTASHLGRPAPAQAGALEPPTVQAEEPLGAFDREVGVGIYYSRWTSTYDAGGIGLRLRWEPLDELGIEVFAELLDVDQPQGTRFDVPAGFSLYVPITLVEGLRIRPKLGLCTMLSFATGGGLGDPGANDVKFGFHAGLGVELALGGRWSIFTDATYQGYFGHARDTHGWTTAISHELEREDSLQLGVGLQLHL